MATSKVHNMDKERRNFPGPQTNKYYNLSDMQDMYKQQSGSTSPGPGVAPIYKKHAKVMSQQGDKLGTQVKLDRNARNG